MNNEEKKTYEENLVNLQEDIQKDAEEVKQVCIYQKEKRIAEIAFRGVLMSIFKSESRAYSPAFLLIKYTIKYPTVRNGTNG